MSDDKPAPGIRVHVAIGTELDRLADMLGVRPREGANESRPHPETDVDLRGRILAKIGDDKPAPDVNPQADWAMSWRPRRTSRRSWGAPGRFRHTGGMLSPDEIDRLRTLIPDALAAIQALIQAVRARGFEPYIGQCGRTPAQQQAAIDAGTTSEHQRISWHELGRAVDFRARLADGSEDTTTHNEPFFRALYEEACKIPGLRSLAYHADGSKILLNGHVWDAGHVEYRAPFSTLIAAVKAEAPELLA
jgi:hypothetical protein